MRITNGMMVTNMLRDITRNQERMDALNRNLSTGKKFLKPSDDPLGVSKSLRLSTDISTMAQFKRNVEDSQSWLATTETATDNMIEILQKVRELTVQGANETNSSTERGAIATEIGQLKDQLINIGNTSYAGSYIFSGYKTDKPLLKEDGSYDLGGSDLSNKEIMDVNLGIGDKFGLNFVGQRIFGVVKSPADIDSPISQGVEVYSLVGESTDLATSPITFNGTDSFDISYGSTPPKLISFVPIVAPPYNNLQVMVNEIQAKINSDFSPLASGILVEVKNNQLSFNSDKPLIINNSPSMPDLGIPSGSVSDKLGLTVKSGEETQLIGMLKQLVTDLNGGNQTEITKALKRLDAHLVNINAVRSEIGVKSNRLELTSNRIDDDTMNLTELLSKNEDADMAEVIMNLKMEENVYKSSLSGGARIIQLSLLDFLR